MFFPRLVIAGARSGIGKTTLTLALMAALSRRGHRVQPFKIGPDYIDPSFHELAVGQPSHNLDAWLMPPKALRTLFTTHAPCSASGCASLAPPALSIIEGVMGLYDGQGQSPRGGTSHVAALLEAPVLLIIDGEGYSLSAAAVVSGYLTFRKGYAVPPETTKEEDSHNPHSFKVNLEQELPDLTRLNIAGVIINRVSSSRHYELLRGCIEANTSLPCLGYLPKNAVPSLPERHLGLVPPEELEEMEGIFAQLADMAEQCIDLPGLLELAAGAPPLDVEQPSGQKPCVELQPEVDCADLRIGVPRDAAFSFYYQDNLDMLESLGAELVYFSPLADASLPPRLDGLYMGGGFPEVFARELEQNYPLRRELLAVLENGLPAYAECGSMLYLCSFLTTRSGADFRSPPSGRPGTFAMTGFFPHAAEMTVRLQQPFGFVTLTLLKDCILGPAGRSFRAHEFHYSRLVEEPHQNAFRVDKQDGRTWTGGLVKKNVVAGYPHVHFRGCPEIAQSFIKACRTLSRRRAAQSASR